MRILVALTPDDVHRHLLEPDGVASLRAALIAAPDVPAALAVAAAYADDPARTPRHRAAALNALAQAAAMRNQPTPPAALAAADDQRVVEAAIDHNLVAGITGVLFHAPRDPATQATRRMIGRTLLARGVLGPHVTRILLDGEDYPAAARAAAAEFVKSVAPAAESPNAQALAWARTAIGWAIDHPDTVFAPFVEAVTADGQAAALEKLLDALPDTDGGAARTAAIAQIRRPRAVN